MNQFREHLGKASEIVASWPAWKIGLLGGKPVTIPEGKRPATDQDLRVGQVFHYDDSGTLVAREVKSILYQYICRYIDTDGEKCHMDGAFVDLAPAPKGMRRATVSDLRVGQLFYYNNGTICRKLQYLRKRCREYIATDGSHRSIDNAWVLSDDDLSYAEFVSCMASPGNNTESDITVAALGITGEGGEIADLIKKQLSYGQDFDRGEMVEEMGDLLYYLQRLANLMGVTLEELQASNREKLTVRFPDGFNKDDAVHRNKDLERAVFDKYREF